MVWTQLGSVLYARANFESYISIPSTVIRGVPKCRNFNKICKTKTKTDFLVSDRFCPKTDGLKTTSLVWRSVVSSPVAFGLQP